MVIVAFAVLDANIEFAFIVFVGAIYITYIAASEYVTVSVCQFLYRTHCATVHVYLSLSEDVTVGVECATLTEVVIASTATKQVAVYLAIEEVH